MKIVNRRLWYFAIAAVLVVISIVSLATVKIKTGVDFSAGTLFSIHFDQPPTRDALRAQLDSMGYQSATVEPATGGQYQYYIRTHQLDQTQNNDFQSALTAKFGTMQVTSETVDPAVASEAVKNAVIAIVVAVIVMLLYIAWAFRKMPNPFKYAVCAVAGLAFDLMMAMGVYSILGAVRGWQIDLMFISGILAVLGFSINNTIIVFDRMRENTTRGVSPDIEVIADVSIVQTLGRSFNSSLTALFTLFVLSLFVGSSIENFVMVLIIGVISGVFTSTFLSPELLVAWQKKNWGSFSGKTIDLAAAKAKS
jgi:preprotein translocase subunit SecF